MVCAVCRIRRQITEINKTEKTARNIKKTAVATRWTTLHYHYTHTSCTQHNVYSISLNGEKEQKSIYCALLKIFIQFSIILSFFISFLLSSDFILIEILFSVATFILSFPIWHIMQILNKINKILFELGDEVKKGKMKGKHLHVCFFPWVFKSKISWEQIMCKEKITLIGFLAWTVWCLWITDAPFEYIFPFKIRTNKMLCGLLDKLNYDPFIGKRTLEAFYESFG